MEQQLVHWSGVSAKGQGRSFFYPAHVRLDISADLVRAVFFSSKEAGSTESDAQEPVLLDDLIAASDGFPVSHYSQTDDNWPGAYLHPDLADSRIGLLGVASMKRDDGFLGSAERDGPGLFVFALNDNGIPIAPFSAHSHSYLSKRDARFTRVMSDQAWPVQVAVPYTGAPFDECSFLVRSNSQFLFSSNLPGWVNLNEPPPVGILAQSLPTLRASSPAIEMTPNENTTVKVRVVDSDGTLYPQGEHTIFLEETGGFLPLRRVKSKEGLASFRISSMGMQSGDAFKVKLGFRNFSGCDEVAVTVL